MHADSVRGPGRRQLARRVQEIVAGRLASARKKERLKGRLKGTAQRRSWLPVRARSGARRKSTSSRSPPRAAVRVCGKMRRTYASATANAPVPWLVSLVVLNYDEALEFFLGKLGFELVEDTAVPEQNKRWVVVRPRGGKGACLLLAKASTEGQEHAVGAQTGGRVFLFLYTDDFWRDYERFRAGGVEFVRPPEQQPHGLVAVFKDLYGNAWDLLQPTSSNRSWQP